MAVPIFEPCVLLDVVEAGDRLGVSRRRVTRLIADSCPACNGSGEMPIEVDENQEPVPCVSCRGYAQRLPAVRIGNSWAVFDWACELPWNVDRSTGVKLEAVHV
jgi:Zn ribbon nucleic-acid-binding protein